MSARVPTWHGYYGVLFVRLYADRPVMHLFGRVVNFGDRTFDGTLCGRQAETWLAFRYATKFARKCRDCDRRAATS